jgi:toxin ParE1/3/4
VNTDVPCEWHVSLTAAAQADLREIVGWTVQHFGSVQADAYAEILTAAIEALDAGPNILGAKRRDDIMKGLHTLHVAREGKRGRHFVLFRVDAGHTQRRIEILRLLHDAMDLARHLSASPN